LWCSCALQFFNAETDQYTVQMHLDKREVRLDLDKFMWRLADKHQKSQAGAAADQAGAAAAAGPAGDSLVGQRIQVWWKDDKCFYSGKVTVSCSYQQARCLCGSQVRRFDSIQYVGICNSMPHQ